LNDSFPFGSTINGRELIKQPEIFFVFLSLVLRAIDKQQIYNIYLYWKA
jgi:hypothetical protein